MLFLITVPIQTPQNRNVPLCPLPRVALLDRYLWKLAKLFSQCSHKVPAVVDKM